jgi:hypothetical protein
VSPPFCVSTNFPIVQWQDTRLLTGESWFESTSGSQFAAVVYGKDTCLSSRATGVRIPVAAPTLLS